MEYVEVFGPGGSQLVPLEGEQVFVGRAATNHVAMESDETMSRTHAVLERHPSGWAVRDMGSRNGTSLNGERLWGARALRPDDEIRVGRTRIVYRSRGGAASPMTQLAQTAPQLTRREQDVLNALCRPLAQGEVFVEPASIRQIAAELVVSDAAVKQHLLNLYDKFGIVGGDERRRVRLANEALTRGAVSLAELRET